MSSKPELLTNAETVLASKERDLIAQRKNVWAFVETDHSSGDTKKYQARVRAADIEIGEILDSLLEGSGISAEFKSEANTLCQRCRELGYYTRDMHKVLSEDLAERHRIEEKKTIDVIKNATFFFAIPAAFITAVKNGFFSEHVNAYQAAESGLGVSTAILARKKIRTAFKSVGKSICDTPQQIRNTYLFYSICMRETLKDNRAALMRSFEANTGLMNIRVAGVVTRGRKFITKLSNRNEPKL